MATQLGTDKDMADTASGEGRKEIMDRTDMMQNAGECDGKNKRQSPGVLVNPNAIETYES
jgi:hypothetical protein